MSGDVVMTRGLVKANPTVVLLPPMFHRRYEVPENPPFVSIEAVSGVIPEPAIQALPDVPVASPDSKLGFVE